MNYENIPDEETNPVFDDASVSFKRRLAYDKLTFFYISLPVSLIGQLFGALLLSALLLTSVEVYYIGIWLTLNVIMFLYRFYHYYAFKNANEYTKLTDAKIWLHKFYTNVFISGMVWGSSAILVFPTDYLAGQMVIVLFLFAISFTSMGVLASKKDLLLGYTLVMFMPIILRFFFLDGSEEYTTIAYVVIALMLILLLISYYFGGIVNNSLRNHQYFIEIKHTHDQLKERFFSLFERAPVGIYYYDLDLRIQDVNAQFLSMHQVEFKEDLIGQEIGSIENKILVDAHSEALKNHTGSYRGPYSRFFLNDAIFVDLSTVPMQDTNGEVTGGI
ncbi:MAG: PAS domain-containing protein, partial [Sulfurimonadaceae bacterium]|nr:PAS domain-containing protein [Sulfurimonadaceae bacterium]